MSINGAILVIVPLKFWVIIELLLILAIICYMKRNRRARSLIYDKNRWN